MQTLFPGSQNFIDALINFELVCDFYLRDVPCEPLLSWLLLFCLCLLSFLLAKAIAKCT